MCIVGKHINALSKTSTAVPIINKSTFSEYEVYVPDKENQTKIANILSSLDDKIELNRRINDNLEQQAQALFKSWFVDFEPWGGKMPSDWKEGTLSEMCRPLREKVCGKQNVKVLSPITTGKLVLSEEYFTKQVYSENIEKYIVVPHNAFAYNPARINIGSIGMNEYDFCGCVSPVYVVFKCLEQYEYYFDLFRLTDKFKEEVKLRAIGGVRQSLGYEDFGKIQIVIPSSEAIKDFNRLYLNNLRMRHYYVEENTKLAQLRDTILPRLMSGELKIS